MTSSIQKVGVYTFIFSRKKGANAITFPESKKVQARAVSSEISRNFSQKISGNLFNYFQKFVKEFFHLIPFNYNHIKI